MKYFAYISGDEIQKLKSPAQLAVYLAIKSFTANGKKSIALSTREIATRCPMSHETVRVTLQEKELSEVLTVDGHQNRIGGNVPIYSIKVSESLPLSTDKVSENLTLSANKVSESLEKVSESLEKVSSTQAQNLPQYNNRRIEDDTPSTPPDGDPHIKTSKNSLTPCTQKELIAIALSLHLEPEDVKDKQAQILDKIADGSWDIKKNGKTMFYTLKNWLRNSISKGWLKRLNDEEYDILKKQWEGSI